MVYVKYKIEGLFNMLKISRISFGNSKNIQVEPNKSIGRSKPDSIEINNKIEPPELTALQIIFNTFTDEQIAQINKAKMLPENACFIYQDFSRTRGHKYEDPYYLIGLRIIKIENRERILPEGYEVKRDLLSGVKAVKIKKD